MKGKIIPPSELVKPHRHLEVMGVSQFSIITDGYKWQLEFQEEVWQEGIHVNTKFHRLAINFCPICGKKLRKLSR